MNVFILYTKWAERHSAAMVIQSAYDSVYSSLDEARAKLPRSTASCMRGYEVEETELNTNKIINRYNFDRKGNLES